MDSYIQIMTKTGDNGSGDGVTSGDVSRSGSSD